MVASDSSTASDSSWLGYVTYVDLPSMGTVGGLLIVDRRARPIEFHCSAPILPTRTQEILYGQTLRSTLVCDQIGRSLVDQLGQLPSILLTNEPMALGLREVLDVPIALFRYKQGDTATDELGSSVIDDLEFEMGGYQFTTSSYATSDPAVIRDSLSRSIGHWDWMEPIERICEAIREAHRAAA